MTVYGEVMYVAQRFAWWNRVRKKLEQRQWPFFDPSTIDTYKGGAINKTLRDYAAIYPELRYLPRARAIRFLRNRGIRIVRIRLSMEKGAKR